MVRAGENASTGSLFVQLADGGCHLQKRLGCRQQSGPGMRVLSLTTRPATDRYIVSTATTRAQR